jgi:hypothetical protein
MNFRDQPEKKRPAPLLSHDLLALKYLGEWSCQEGFMIWKSEDGEALQLTGPEGEVIVLIQLKSPSHNRLWLHPEGLPQGKLRTLE